MNAVAAYVSLIPGRRALSSFMPQFRNRADQDFFQIWDGRGHPLARSDSSVGRDLRQLCPWSGVARSRSGGPGRP